MEGPYELGGCGFFNEFDDKKAKPGNENTISEEFKVSLPVHIIVKFGSSEVKYA